MADNPEAIREAELSEFAPRPTPVKPGRTYLWWLVLGLVGLDYFSTLAYLPSMAVESADRLAPLAAGAVVFVTLLGALPIYLYVVGRSPHGAGATGLLERLVSGWKGKLLILVLLGFVATDYIITRSLSLADATKHLLHNPHWQDQAARIAADKEAVKSWFPPALQGRFFDIWNQQLVVTVALSVIVFGFWALMGLFQPFFLRVAAALVAIYLLLTLLIIGSCLAYLVNQPQIFHDWGQLVSNGLGAGSPDRLGLISNGILAAFFFFPYLVLGLSGFELTMASAALVRGRPDDQPEKPAGRIRNTRKLMAAAALLMSVCLLGSVLVVTLLVPKSELRIKDLPDRVAANEALESDADQPHQASDRALAYLAHGGRLRERGLDETINPLFGPTFGSLYDLVTILVLCLAGISVSLGMRDLLPHYLARYGMQLAWAQKIGVITHLFNGAILIVIVVFRASVEAQQWAYATSVMVLLTAAALAATLDVRVRWPYWLGYLASIRFGVFLLFFLFMTGLLVWINASGLAIALIFVMILLGTAITSRWLRSTELRFEGFVFQDEQSRRRWEVIRNLEFQVLVPHQPGHLTLAAKDRDVRKKHRLADDVPIIFIEVLLEDPSEFYQQPLMEIRTEDGKEVIRVSRCNSVAHVLAAIGLEFRHVGIPPEIHFDWSNEAPMAANLGFLLLGQGNVPWMVHALIRKVEHDPRRQPRVVIG